MFSCPAFLFSLSFALLLSSVLVPLFFSGNVEVVVESARALGNFSRNADVRKDIIRLRGTGKQQEEGGNCGDEESENGEVKRSRSGGRMK